MMIQFSKWIIAQLEHIISFYDEASFLSRSLLTGGGGTAYKNVRLEQLKLVEKNIISQYGHEAAALLLLRWTSDEIG